MSQKVKPECTVVCLFSNQIYTNACGKKKKINKVPRGANTAAYIEAFDSKEAPASIFTSSRNTGWKNNAIVKLHHLF